MTQLAASDPRSTGSAPTVPWWGRVSSAAAPVLLIGGWTVAAARQPPGYSSVTDTISALAGHGAEDRWIMTGALVGVGAAYLLTAFSLGGLAARPGRWLLGAGGVCTLGVAAFPLPATGSSVAHTAAASLAFGALAAWPFLAVRRDPAAAPVLRAPASVAAGAVLTGVVGWFVVELARGERVGLAERVAAGAQALWPLAVVAGCALWARRRQPGEAGRPKSQP